MRGKTFLTVGLRVCYASFLYAVFFVLLACLSLAILFLFIGPSENPADDAAVRIGMMIMFLPLNIISKLPIMVACGIPVFYFPVAKNNFRWVYFVIAGAVLGLVPVISFYPFLMFNLRLSLIIAFLSLLWGSAAGFLLFKFANFLRVKKFEKKEKALQV